MKKKNKFRISQAHSENVNKLPDQKYNFEIYGKSDTCDCEIVVDKNEKIFMFQGHPEYIPEFNINRAAPFFSQDKSDEGIQNMINQFINDEFVKNIIMKI